MSESRVLPYQEVAPRIAGTLAGSIAVALVTAAIGWLLVRETIWQTHHLLASLVSFMILAGIVNFFWALEENAGRFGEANQATLLRSGLVCLIGSTLLASGAAPYVGWPLIGLIAVALALDAVDGFLARRFNVSSAFGARFDMEIDALLLLILSLLVWRTGQAGIWVLAIGLMRYAFVAAGWFQPFLNGPLGRSWRRKSICALQGIALLACLLPPLDQTKAMIIAAGALTCLVVSFALDIRMLHRGRSSFGGINGTVTS
ncbi:MAG: CDP-alcohol phosphatidyltransferase family protein [Geminicoccaceae bacterium]